MKINLHDILKRDFGFTSFRPGQEEILRHLFANQILGNFTTGAVDSAYQMYGRLPISGWSLFHHCISLDV